MGQDFADGEEQLNENHDLVISKPWVCLGKSGSSASNILDNNHAKKPLSFNKDGEGGLSLLLDYAEQKAVESGVRW